MSTPKIHRPWLNAYEPHVPHEIDLNAYKSIVDAFEQAFKKFEKNPSFHNMGRTISYGELDEYSAKFADYLQNVIGLKKGDRLAVMMPNILQYPIAIFGALRAGVIIVNINPLYTPRELEHQLNDSGATAIVIFENACSTLEKVINNTKVKTVITTQIGDMLSFPKSILVNTVIKHVKKMVPPWSLPNSVAFLTALHSGQRDRLKSPVLNHDDTAFFQYTGGTTGVSKGAELTHGNMIANLLQARSWIQSHLVEGKEIIITPLPLYHIFSMTANCLVYSTVGALNVLITNPRDAKGFVKELKKWRFTAMTGLNTLFNMLNNHPDFHTVDFSSLKLTLGGGMAVQKTVADAWKKITGCMIIEAYGLTETSPAACINPFNIKDYTGYIGVPLSSTDVVIRDDNNNDVKFGDVGEICIKGPQVMRGYFNKPEETEKVMTTDGFFKSGDLGFMTPEGFIKIVDRKKDMILVSGFNVYPNEIEDVVMRNPKVLECAAVAAPDQHSGEVVKIVIVKKDQSLTEAEVIDFCRKELTGYKVPKKVEFRKELPKSNVGKVLRKDLR
ncbi:MAG: AMP-binding protein [Proteobacteria bacterium]|nr:AMP-binding protein [Pseudomonadota bacterium]